MNHNYYIISFIIWLIIVLSFEFSCLLSVYSYILNDLIDFQILIWFNSWWLRWSIPVFRVCQVETLGIKSIYLLNHLYHYHYRVTFDWHSATDSTTIMHRLTTIQSSWNIKSSLMFRYHWNTVRSMK